MSNPSSLLQVLSQWSETVSKSTKLQFGILIVVCLFVGGGYALGKHLAKQDSVRCDDAASKDC